MREGQPEGLTPRSPGPAVSEEQTKDLLAFVRQANEDLYSSLKSFVCNEAMHRYVGRINAEGSRQIDIISAKLSFENGVEHYTEIRQNDHERESISNITGAWSTGEFGTLLLQTHVLLETQPVLFAGHTDLDGIPAAIYRLNISEQDSPWDLVIRSEHFRIPFRTEIWVSRATGQILKIERTSTGVPSRQGISEITWRVALHAVELNGKTWLLPSTGEYTVLYEHSADGSGMKSHSRTITATVRRLHCGFNRHPPALFDVAVCTPIEHAFYNRWAVAFLYGENRRLLTAVSNLLFSYSFLSDSPPGLRPGNASPIVGSQYVASAA